MITVYILQQHIEKWMMTKADRYNETNKTEIFRKSSQPYDSYRNRSVTVF